MKKTALLFFSAFVCVSIFAQKKQPVIDLQKTESAILEEGKKLYQLQMATTLGLDAFLQLSKDVVDNAAGYFAYKEGKFYKCVFYNNLYNADIISTILFDSSFNKVRTAISTTLRPMTNNERDLYFMRIRTLDEIKKTRNRLFNFLGDGWSLFLRSFHDPKKITHHTRRESAAVK